MQHRPQGAVAISNRRSVGQGARVGAGPLLVKQLTHTALTRRSHVNSSSMCGCCCRKDGSSRRWTAVPCCGRHAPLESSAHTGNIVLLVQVDAAGWNRLAGLNVSRHLPWMRCVAGVASVQAGRRIVRRTRGGPRLPMLVSACACCPVSCPCPCGVTWCWWCCCARLWSRPLSRRVRLCRRIRRSCWTTPSRR